MVTNLFPQFYRYFHSFRMCNFNEIFHEYTFIRYDNSERGKKKAMQDIIKLLAQHGVEKSITDKIEHDSMVSKTGHSTFFYPKRKIFLNMLQNDTYIKNLFKRIYYFDYLLFHYDVDELMI
ncbi:hypothetical protein WR25_14679 [Diploscapter pachys]|uniref:Uncharacterized protein n=1 Tax=Diploscapter pachys TaxID=2018661 RepID=A0A2A2KAG2_9BILA|nr:hypothetical protein WR25_14679 [Diploscapter pachys]